MQLDIGDIIRLKKPHPCGGYEWKIHRAGVDFRIECLKCGHQLMISRIKLEKSFKKMISKSE